MKRHIDRKTHWHKDGCIRRWERKTDRQLQTLGKRQRERETYGWMDRWMDGWMQGGYIHTHRKREREPIPQG
jgi:hypothetical protein